MASFSGRQWSAIILGTLLFISLFFINRKLPKEETGKMRGTSHATEEAVNFDSIFSKSEARVPAVILNRINKIKAALAQASSAIQEKLYDSIVDIYDSAGAQIPATYYAEKEANLLNSSELWYQAGDRYYKCSFIVDSAAHGLLLQRAVQCFDNSIKADSNNLEAVVGKGECLVQGGGAPMVGIELIKGVLKKDTNNEKALIALGVFDIQSGQFPNALSRFTKVLKIDPTFTDAYVFMAQASEATGNKKAAIGYLKKYSTFARDSAKKADIDDYIKKLETDTTTQRIN